MIRKNEKTKKKISTQNQIKQRKTHTDKPKTTLR